MKSLLARLQMVVIVALLPAVTVMLYTGLRGRQDRAHMVDEDARRLLYAVSAQQQEIVDGSKQVLDAIIATLADDVPEHCHRFLANLLLLSTRYNAASVIDADGRVSCASNLNDAHASFADRAFFRIAMQTSGAAVGDFVIGSVTGRPTLRVAKLYTGRDGKPAGVVTLGIDLDVVHQHLTKVAAPSNAVFLVADRNGRILARHPEIPGHVGTNLLAENEFMLSDKHIGTTTAVTRDGRRLLTAYLPPAANADGLLILAGLDPAVALTPVERASRDSLFLIAGSAVLALLLTTLLGTRLIRRPIDQLIAIAERWTAGDLTARTGLAGAPDEFGRLALSFESMAAVLAAREASLRRITEDLESQLQREAVARETAQNRQAERMQALGERAAGVAHDVKNVLQTIAGAMALIERRSDDRAGIGRLARITNAAIDRGIAVIGRLLTSGRRGDLQAQNIDVSALLRDLQENLTLTSGAQVATKVVIRNSVGSLIADRGQLETVLINLSTHAREAMPGAGQLVIAAERETVLAGTAGRVAGLDPGHYVRLSVASKGTGMSAATLAWPPFVTAQPPRSELGPGLATARSFAQQSGGALDLKSVPDEGTTVTLWLPAGDPGLALSAGDAGFVPAAAAMASAPRWAGEADLPARILLVDDEASIREIFTEHLQDAGHSVLVAADGAAALATIDEDRTIDILITDLAMPGMDGLSLIRAVKIRRPDLPAILVTGYAGEQTALAVSRFEQGTVSLLRKPVSAAKLLGEIDAMLSPHRACAPFQVRLEARDGLSRR